MNSLHEIAEKSGEVKTNKQKNKSTKTLHCNFKWNSHSSYFKKKQATVFLVMDQYF